MPSFHIFDQCPKIREPWKVIKIGETIEPTDFVDCCLGTFLNFRGCTSWLGWIRITSRVATVWNILICLGVKRLMEIRPTVSTEANLGKSWKWQCDFEWARIGISDGSRGLDLRHHLRAVQVFWSMIPFQNVRNHTSGQIHSPILYGQHIILQILFWKFHSPFCARRGDMARPAYPWHTALMGSLLSDLGLGPRKAASSLHRANVIMIVLLRLRQSNTYKTGMHRTMQSFLPKRPQLRILKSVVRFLELSMPSLWDVKS